MKTLLVKITSTLIVASSLLATANTANACISKGYFKSNGSYVAPHFRTSPDSYTFNNFSAWK